ncbi:flagellar hook-associated protein FlgK [Pseudomonas chlororaphis subsp. aurantiaca]|uniref:flagellar hook-associated protein FlgK n=1 Tax=Pseudomonas chlororaphis TaxID=587753 RepID=UPI0027DE020A|nr:flagellar hook-associated protein FlgK [Pseudomonas chlororaphis]WMI97589.1 flagellar hook-associated protein FlgK [Pseudomonas chlororaphis subsp. aurantiaca]
MSLMSHIGYSGMAAAQVALNTTANNVANMFTPGYSRLTTVMGSVGGTSEQTVGGGVTVTSVRRMSDTFKTQQLWRATTNMQYYQAGQDYLGPMEGVMAAEGSSISVGLDNFYGALSAASDSPGGIPQRQQILSEMKNLTQRFNGLNNHINNQINALHGQRSAMGNEINGLASNLALLNQKIVDAQSTGADTSALLDSREQLVGQLSQYADVRVNEARDGSLRVSLSNGQPLVSGSSAGQLSVTTNAAGEQEVALEFAGSSFPLQQNNLGGAFGGLYDVEHNNLLPARENLMEMAGALTTMANDTLSRGYDLNGNPGQALLTFSPNSVTGLLKMNDLKPEELALSGIAGDKGNNDVLLALAELKNHKVTVAGSSVTLSEAYSGMLGEVASASRQNQADFKSAQAVADQAQSQRDSVSAVNKDEEALMLMDYNKALQANMKVVQTANELFNNLLAAF